MVFIIFVILAIILTLFTLFLIEKGEALFIITGIVSLMLWLGLGFSCDSRDKEPVEQLLTPVESMYIQKQSFANRNFDLALEQVKAQRTAPYTNPHPFCDSLDYVKSYSLKLRASSTMKFITPVYLHDLLDLYYSANPKALQECIGSVSVPVIQEEDKVVIAPKVEQPQIPVELVEELTEVAKSCNRAKTLLTVHDDLNSLSVTKAEKIIKDCKFDKLREELNK